MKTRVEKFLVQLTMAEATGDQPGQQGTLWKTSAEDFARILETSARTWATGCTYGPKPEVTVILEERRNSAGT